VKLLIATYPAVTLLDGGIRTQVLALKRELGVLGHQADLFDTWQRYEPKDYDWFYLVGAHVGTVHLARAVKNVGMKLAVSPVYFSTRSPSALGRRIAWSEFWRGATHLVSEAGMTREICRLADLVLPNTRAEAELVSKAFGLPESKVKKVPNGVDERFLNATPDAFFAKYGKKNFVLYCGHVGYGRKNLLALIEVMKGIDRPLVIVGKALDNEYGRECRSSAREVKDCLLIPGLEHDSEMLVSAYAACDTFCLPSDFETPGLAALEAALAGAKVVITDQGGTREYFGSHARYVVPCDLKGLRRVLNESLSVPRSTALREHVRLNFLWRRAGEKLVEALSARSAGDSERSM
jgi:glycosyltransferase involved in cell wall biosynthesis